jgi:hypothetical protein
MKKRTTTTISIFINISAQKSETWLVCSYYCIFSFWYSKQAAIIFQCKVVHAK